MLASARLQVEALKATYRQKLAEAKGAEDTLDYQQREFDRQRQLAASGVAARSTFEQVQNALQVARQKVASTQSDVANALAQLGGNPDLPPERHPAVQRAQAALDKAELDLSYTMVKAAEPGIVTKVDQLQVGSYATASTPVFSMISKRVWIEANFKETELTHMRPGQTRHGRGRHLSRASCSTPPSRASAPAPASTFSLLPAENATGNWVKVVQRLPVRLALEDPKDRRCMPG